VELRAVLLQATAERKKFLADQTTLAVLSGDPADVKKWRQLQKAEEIKAMYKKLRFIRRDNTNQSGLSRLEVPTDPTDDPKKCTSWKTVNSAEEITQYLLARNRSHFGQAAGTPFTVPPLKQIVDFRASTTECNLTILRRKY
jgi:hypothetical protein